jgi:hypothetical protein
VGVGSTFTVVLPLRQASRGPAASADHGSTFTDLAEAV